MNVAALLPTKKVSAFLVGAAAALLGFWILGPDNLDVLAEPPLEIGIAAAIFLGFLFAWFVPEGVWERVARHSEEGPVILPDPLEPGH